MRVNRLRRHFAILHGHYCRGRTCRTRAVPNRVHAIEIRSETIVHRNETFGRAEPKQPNQRRLFLPNSFHDLIRRHHKFRTGYGLRRRTPRSVGRAQFDAQALKAGHLSPFEYNAVRLSEEPEFDSFAAGKLVLVLVAAHLRVGSAIDYRHAAIAKSPGDGSAVDGRVAGSDDDHVAADLHAFRRWL